MITINKTALVLIAIAAILTMTFFLYAPFRVQMVEKTAVTELVANADSTARAFQSQAQAMQQQGLKTAQDTLQHNQAFINSLYWSGVRDAYTVINETAVEIKKGN